MASTNEPVLKAEAGGAAKQVNVAGDNFGPLYLAHEHRDQRLVHQLPFSPSDFTGRQALFDDLFARLTATYASGMINLYGIPGVGKSALAIRLANALAADRYPDCQFYFNLRESDGQPVSSYDVLGGALVALGVRHAEVPTGTEARAAIFRSALVGHRSVIVIDNATTAADVEPLLPGSMIGAAVIITSWAPVAELPGVDPIALQTLDDDEAVQMLHRVPGREPVATELAVVQEIAHLAGNLPLALRIAGGLLKKRPHWTWSDLRRKLADVDGSARLERLVAGTLAVETTFGLAYHALEPRVAKGYRLLGLAPSAQMSRLLAQVLVDPDAEVAQDVIDVLTDMQLLQADTPRTFRMHDLLWRQARALIEAEDASAQEAAVQRMTAWSLTQLGTKYLSRFGPDLDLAAPFAAAFEERVSDQIYVDSPVHALTSSDLRPLRDMFDTNHRLVLIGVGGTGKTTMVNHLCHLAARRRLHDQTSPAPIIALIRDLPGQPDTDIPALLLRILRHRFDVDLTPDALLVALRSGSVFVVLDGLDELVDHQLRFAVLQSIKLFAATYPSTPLLVTTRPYAEVEADLAGFTHVTVAPWTSRLWTRYLAGLLSVAPESLRHRSHELQGRLNEWIDAGLLDSPLALQMVLSAYDRFGRVPRTHTMLINEVVLAFGILRETRRGLLDQAGPAVLHRVLMFVAFAMQSNPENRVFIRFSELQRLVTQVLETAGDKHDDWYYRDVAEGITRRSVLLRQVDGYAGREPSIAFTHTLFREHLAAAHVARMTPDQFAAVVIAYQNDPSWEAVLRSAVELATNPRSPDFLDQVTAAISAAGSHGLAKAFASWRRAAQHMDG
ncbi:NACHT domain-containing protein [Micromonospora sp. CPCC 206061]|uniref:NACHT domain-containing protein n=1 Tax=Micromonospora sp. CPCC 206061 TaxID=3122410 RepID=UPI002FEEA5E4